MSEICLDCLNKLLGTNYSERDFIISDDLDLCEDCGEWKNVVVARSRGYQWRGLQRLVEKFFLGKRIILNVCYFV